MPEVTELMGQHRDNGHLNQTYPEIANNRGRTKKKKSPKSLKPKKHSKSPSPPKTFNIPHLFTKRTHGNRYCGCCQTDEIPQHVRDK